MYSMQVSFTIHQLSSESGICIELMPSLIPSPPPRFYLAAVEKNQEIFLHGCKLKSGWRLGNKAN